LVIALAMVMGDVLCECATEMAFADRDDPIEAFGLDRSYEAFDMRVGIRRASGRLHDGNARVAEDAYLPPKTWARRAYPSLSYFHEVDRGGHFAACEQPELFAAELRAAFRTLREAQ
jgi:pimeloyl-ACP methyl ester carboxylesterase